MLNRTLTLHFSRKPPFYKAAFTLLELIIVILLVAILAAYVIPKFSSSTTYKQDTIVEQLISSGQLVQQLSMNDSSRTFLLSIQSDQINLLENGAAFAVGDIRFPIQIDGSISLSPATTISYDGLGETSQTVITVSGESPTNVCFQSTGLIHRC